MKSFVAVIALLLSITSYSYASDWPENEMKSFDANCNSSRGRMTAQQVSSFCQCEEATVFSIPYADMQAAVKATGGNQSQLFGFEPLPPQSLPSDSVASYRVRMAISKLTVAFKDCTIAAMTPSQRRPAALNGGCRDIHPAYGSPTPSGYNGSNIRILI